MSVWTHVAGVIRVDDLPWAAKKDFDKIFRSSTFNNPNPDCNMPCGSEGSLQCIIWTNPADDDLFRYNITIWGDLRNYGTARIPEIKEWWDKTLKMCGMIRQAVLEINPEDGQRVILTEPEED